MDISNAYKAIAIVVFLVTGSIGGVLINVLYNIQVKGFHNIMKPFQRPWFQVWVMFISMSLLIFFTPFIRTRKCLPYKIGQKQTGWGLFRFTGLTALLDLLCTTLQFVAYIFLKPSIWQMLKGSILIFTALFSHFYRKKHLNKNQWVGVIVTIIGMILVGLSSILSDEKQSQNLNNVPNSFEILAVVLIFIAQALQAFKVILEEELLHDEDALPCEVVSYEGLWGVFFLSFILIPIANIIPENKTFLLYENSIESFYMAFNSKSVLLFEFLYILLIAAYNQTGMLITQFSNAIIRNIWEVLKSLGVWIVSIFFYYALDKFDAGEGLHLISLLQLFGFIVCIFGLLIYTGKIKFPCLSDQFNLSGTSMLGKTQLANTKFNTIA